MIQSNLKVILSKYLRIVNFRKMFLCGTSKFDLINGSIIGSDS